MPWLWFNPPAWIGFPGGAILLVLFGLIVVMDVEYKVILHVISLAGAILGAGIGIFWRAQQFLEKVPDGAAFSPLAPWWYGVWTTALGGLAGFGTMWLLYLLGELTMRIAARLRGQVVDDVALGFGDVNLSGVIGLILGWQVIWIALVLAIMLGGLVSLGFMLVMLALRRYHLFMALPYGPYLVTGAALLIYFREAILAFLK
jgi:leader peptidase (prepilin peptidase)/N-methyltransferase